MDAVRRVMVVVVAFTATLTACSSGSSPSAVTSSPSATPSPAERTVWLCRPGMPDNPCEGNLQTTVVSPDGRRTTQPFKPAVDPKIDCFYAYPTVSSATSV